MVEEKKEKINCWQYFNCRKYRSCPAYTNKSLNGFNGGKNAGRAYWVLEKTLCQPDLAKKKQKNHFTCPFYLRVMDEEGADFLYLSVIRQKMKSLRYN